MLPSGITQQLGLSVHIHAATQLPHGKKTPRGLVPHALCGATISQKRNDGFSLLQRGVGAAGDLRGHGGFYAHGGKAIHTWIPFLTVCLCVCVHVHRCICGSSCVCGPRGQQLTLDIFTQEPFTFIFELRSFICSVLTKLVRLTRQQGLWICGLFYSRTRITSAHNHTYCVLGTQLVLQEPCTLPIGH